MLLQPSAAPRTYTFPYTTLFRSLDEAEDAPGRRGPEQDHRPTHDHGDEDLRDEGEAEGRHHPRERGHHRSEEHTSELQSRQYLVCRLLLEKKRINAIKPSHLVSV